MYDNLFDGAMAGSSGVANLNGLNADGAAARVGAVPAANSTDSNQLFQTMLRSSMDERDKTLLTKIKERLGKFKKRYFVFALLIASGGLAYFAYTNGIVNFNPFSSNTALVQPADKNGDDTADSVVSDRIKVYILGAVAQPGVIELSEGDRINDALAAAGGAKADAALSYINLALKVEDGQEIYVPTLAEIDSGYFEKISGVIAAGGVTGAQEANSAGAGTTGSSSASSATGSSGIVNGKVNLNKATLTELQTLAGIGAATAQKIIDYRTANGGFKTIEQLKNVSGIGEAKYAAVAGSIMV